MQKNFITLLNIMLLILAYFKSENLCKKIQRWNYPICYNWEAHGVCVITVFVDFPRRSINTAENLVRSRACVIREIIIGQRTKIKQGGGYICLGAAYYINNDRTHMNFSKWVYHGLCSTFAWNACTLQTLYYTPAILHSFARLEMDFGSTSTAFEDSPSSHHHKVDYRRSMQKLMSMHACMYE